MASASDNFNRANGSLGANWTDYRVSGSPFQITSNVVTVTTPGSDTGAYYNAASFGVDQFAQADITVNGAGGGDQGMGLFLRLNDPAIDFYRVVIDHSTSGPNFGLGVSKDVGGTYTNLLNGNISSWTDGSTLRVEVTGTSPTTIKVYIAGALVATVTDSTSPITHGGNCGLFFSSSETSASADNWSAGDLVTTGIDSNVNARARIFVPGFPSVKPPIGQIFSDVPPPIIAIAPDLNQPSLVRIGAPNLLHALPILTVQDVQEPGAVVSGVTFNDTVSGTETTSGSVVESKVGADGITGTAQSSGSNGESGVGSDGPTGSAVDTGFVSEFLASESSHQGAFDSADFLVGIPGRSLLLVTQVDTDSPKQSIYNDAPTSVPDYPASTGFVSESQTFETPQPQSPFTRFKLLLNLQPETAKVTVYNDVPTSTASSATTFSDNFNRADSGTLGSGWTAITTAGGMSIVGNEAAMNLADHVGNFRNAETYGKDQFAEITVTTTALNFHDFIGAMVRSTNGGDDFYTVFYFDNNAVPGNEELWLYKRVAGGFAGAGGGFLAYGDGTFPSGTLSPGDVVRIEVRGRIVKAYLNGVLKLAAYDADHDGTSSSPGVFGFGFSHLDNYNGGELLTPGAPAVVTDDFNRADGSNFGGSSNWQIRNVTNNPSAPSVASNRIVGTSSLTLGGAYNVGRFNNDQASQITGMTVPGGSWMGVTVRDMAPVPVHYLAIAFNTGGSPIVRLYKELGLGNFVQLGSDYTIPGGAILSSDVLRLEATGSTITAKYNGATAVSVTDTDITGGGAPGLLIFDVASGDNWQGEGGVGADTTTATTGYLSESLTSEQSARQSPLSRFGLFLNRQPETDFTPPAGTTFNDAPSGTEITSGSVTESKTDGDDGYTGTAAPSGSNGESGVGSDGVTGSAVDTGFVSESQTFETPQPQRSWFPGSLRLAPLVRLRNQVATDAPQQSQNFDVPVCDYPGATGYVSESLTQEMSQQEKPIGLIGRPFFLAIPLPNLIPEEPVVNGVQFNDNPTGTEVATGSVTAESWSDGDGFTGSASSSGNTGESGSGSDAPAGSVIASGYVSEFYAQPSATPTSLLGFTRFLRFPFGPFLNRQPETPVAGPIYTDVVSGVETPSGSVTEAKTGSDGPSGTETTTGARSESRVGSDLVSGSESSSGSCGSQTSWSDHCSGLSGATGFVVESWRHGAGHVGFFDTPHGTGGTSSRPSGATLGSRVRNTTASQPFLDTTSLHPRTYAALAAGWATYLAVLNAFATYEELLAGEVDPPYGPFDTPGEELNL